MYIETIKKQQHVTALKIILFMEWRYSDAQLFFFFLHFSCILFDRLNWTVAIFREFFFLFLLSIVDRWRDEYWNKIYGKIYDFLLVPPSEKRLTFCLCSANHKECTCACHVCLYLYFYATACVNSSLHFIGSV